MRLIAFINAGTQIRKILDLIGVDTEPPHIGPEWDLAAQAAPAYEVDQRVNW